MSKTHVHSLRKLEYEILQQGYSLAYKILNASDYGVASSRKRLIAVAAAPGRNLPDWPTPTHGGNGRPSLLTLGDVISDLQWINPTCKSASKRNAPTRIDHPEDVFQKVASHCTHCSSRKICGWDDALTLPKWDEPIPTIRTQPTDRWKCRHPKFCDRVLTVREMARAMSFPDHWLFKGSAQNQYKQVGNSVPPRLAEAVAWEIKSVLSTSRSQ